MVLRSNKSDSPLRALKRMLAAPLILLAAVILVLEDWLWDDLQRLAAAIGRLPVLRAIESLIVGLPPYAALACFGVPTLLLVPVKLAALYFISHGRPTLGLLTVIVAKVAGTALVARIFTLTRASLLRIGWFSVLYTWFVGFRDRIYGAIKASYVYRVAHIRYLQTRQYLRGWLSRREGTLRRRWSAALKLSRKRRQAQE